MLQLRHVFFRCGFLRERPRQHELGLEDCPSRFDPTIEGSCHPPERRMANPALNVGQDLT
jgi:hypothetical protein